MRAQVTPASLSGTIAAIASKSQAHRALIAAALADGTTDILCQTSSEDIEATSACLRALCADIQGDRILRVSPTETKPMAFLACNESGSTFRFMVPVVAAMGTGAYFLLKGRLPDRPMTPLYEAIRPKGVCIKGEGTDRVTVTGKLEPGVFKLPGNVSSQYITGLCFALPLLEGDSVIEIQGHLESSAYIDMTLNVLKAFGINFDWTNGQIKIPGKQVYRSPQNFRVEGDWSNGAFWLCAGALSREGIRVTGLNPDTLQGDRAILNVLRDLGALVQVDEEGFFVAKSDHLKACSVDASQIPDLVPAIGAVAGLAKGRTLISGAARLRLKESDRLQTVAATITALGGRAIEEPDGLVIEGRSAYQGGLVDAAGDHRIAMMGAIMGSIAKGTVVIEGAQAVNKSYPDFFDDFKALGGQVRLEEV